MKSASLHEGQAQNTDRELWREREGDFYADSIHVTKRGAIGIDCGGSVFVKPLREWHRLAEQDRINTMIQEAAKLPRLSNERVAELIRSLAPEPVDSKAKPSPRQIYNEVIESVWTESGKAE